MKATNYLHKKILLNILIFISIGDLNSQYPFEIYKPMVFINDYERSENWKVVEKYRDGFSPKDLMTITLRDYFLDHSSLVIESKPLRKKDASILRLYKNRKIVANFILNLPIFEENVYRVIVADIDGNGLKDIGIKTSYRSNGLGLSVNNNFIFQIADGEFTQIQFDDMSDQTFEMRDINNDGNYELFTCHLQKHKNHNYWLYNVYSFDGKKLVNVNESIDYPIMIQILEKQNHKITKNLSRAAMKRYIIIDPELYKWIK